MSFTTITISSTTYWAATLVLISSWKAKTHRSAASSSFTAIRPTAEIAFRAKTTSISYAYSLNSESNTSMFFKSASLTSSSSFSNLMYRGSWNAQKNTLTSFSNRFGHLYKIKLILRNATY